MSFKQLWKIYGRAFLIALLVLYLPHTFRGFEISDGHTVLFLMMPGIFIGSVVYSVLDSFLAHPSNVVFLIGSAVFTVLLIVILAIIGARGKAWQIAAIILGGGYSTIAAVALYRWYSS